MHLVGDLFELSHQLSYHEDDLYFCCVVDYIYTAGLGVTFSVFSILLFDYVGDGTRSSDNKRSLNSKR